ncbi:hypothetical protein ADK43_40215 [Streptomyces rimosus subsp. rimosus]|nr:hypothetical protein ADK43_40215 [Streptomyces rimosus subsp. rimosus]
MTKGQPKLPEQPIQGDALALRAVPPRQQTLPVLMTEQPAALWAAEPFSFEPQQTQRHEPIASAEFPAAQIAPKHQPRDPLLQQMPDGTSSAPRPRRWSGAQGPETALVLLATCQMRPVPPMPSMPLVQPPQN